MGKARRDRRRKEGGGLYAVAIGSNRPLSARLAPRAIVEAAFAALDRSPLRLIARAPVIASRPIGPSARAYANSAAVVGTDLSPVALLDHLQGIEAAFGRRRHLRWGARTLDLDIVLWSGGAHRSRRLTIPHAAFAARDFVLGPLGAVAPRWRDPASGLSIAQLAARLTKPKPVDPAPVRR
ncbi:MAG: 2-amino-4-hydroxy-6-hydroxymethyldihydropteridine diphosphokinase [Sphingobium sp.]